MQSRKKSPRVPAPQAPRQRATPVDSAPGARPGAALSAAAAAARPGAGPGAAFETLEGRALMSAVLFADGVLTLNGDEARSNILRVDYNGGKNVTAIANGVYRSVPRNLVASVQITGGGGIDRIRIGRMLTAPTTINCGPGNDNVLGGGGADVVYGGDGNDVITGRAGRDKLIGGAGYDTLMGTRGIDLMFQGSDTPDPDVPPIIPPLPVPDAPPPVEVTHFGAKADGVADDSAAIQAAIDAAPSGATINFAPGTYRITRGLIVTKPLTLIGNGSLLVLDSKTDRGRQITIASRLSTFRSTWDEPVAPGQQEFRVSVPQSELGAGDMVFLELGQDLYDPYMPNFSGVVKVVENTGSTVTIDRPIPYAITSGTTVTHRITRIQQLAQNVTVKGFRVNHTATTIPDAGVWVQQAMNVQVEDFSGRAANLAVVVESQDVTLRNIGADVTFPHPQGGRLLSLWQTDRVQMFDGRVRTETDQPVIFLESWCRDTTIDGLQIDWNVTTPGQSNVIHWGAGSYGIFADNVTVRNTAPIRFVGTGGTPADYSFGAVEVTGPVTSLPAYLTTRLTLGGKVLTEIGKVHKEVELQSDYGLQVPLVSGALVRKVTVTLNNKFGVKSVLLQSALGQGVSLLPDLKANEPLVVAGAGSFGSSFLFNDIDGSEKLLYVYTGPGVVPGTKVNVDVEYYKL